MLHRPSLLVAAAVAWLTAASPYPGLAADIEPGSRVITTATAPVQQGRTVLARVPAKTELRVVQVREGWVGVELKRSGKRVVGWVQQKYVVTSGSASTETRGRGAGSSTPAAAGGGPTVTLTAISLRELRAKLNEPQATQFFGATRVYGFLLASDELGNDCVLITDQEPGRPVLRLDDFKVAYRNVDAGGSRPACTIDPRPDVLQRLSSISEGIGTVRSMAEMQRLIREYEQIARAEQDVHVFSVDVQTHFAQVMVEADYYLKSVCNGDAQVAGVTSLTQFVLADARKELSKHGRLQMPLKQMNRFWFNAGKVTYRTSGDRFMLGSCPVVLLTEEEAMTAGGGRVGFGRPSPHAKAFADGFTARYAQAAKTKPVYRELENAYRFVALAELLLGQEARGRAGPVVESLLQEVRIPQVAHRPTRPGQFAVGRLDMSFKVPNGRREVHLRLPSCGGVVVGVHFHEMERRPDPAGVVDRIATAALSTRPSPRAAWWKFRSASSPASLD
jgi:hypothetical protein